MLLAVDRPWGSFRPSLSSTLTNVVPSIQVAKICRKTILKMNYGPRYKHVFTSKIEYQCLYNLPSIWGPDCAPFGVDRTKEICGPNAGILGALAMGLRSLAVTRGSCYWPILLGF